MWKDKTKQAEYNRQRYEKTRTWINELKSVPCADCGQTYPPYVMDFDHCRGVKLFNISQIGVGRMKGRAIIEAELAKCDVVCSNCHRIRTHSRLS
jgi:hypothetical protein